MLERNITRKKRVNEKLSEPNKYKFKIRNNKEYKEETIINSAIYGYEVKDQLLSLFYLVLYKIYLKEENIQELSAAVIHL